MTTRTFVRSTILREAEGATAILGLSDGSEIQYLMATTPFEPTSMIKILSHDMQRRQVQIVTTRDDSAILEMPDPTGISERRGRTVIYLDQNHWSTLSATIHRPGDVRRSERAAALDLLDLAAHHKVILPISFGHISETRQWSDPEERYRLAVTIVQVGRGWQLRDPLHVRELELRSALSRVNGLECVLPIDAVTLVPGAICSGRESSLPDFADLGPAPFEMQISYLQVKEIAGTFDALLDSQPEPRGLNPGWVERNERFRDWLQQNTSQAQQRRKLTRAFFLHDVSGELATAAARTHMNSTQLREWWSGHAEADLKEMPALGFYSEALHDRSVNATAAWEDNDLTDLFYLSCAAGYAEHLVCERETAGVLRQGAQRLKRPLSVHSSIQSLIERISKT